MSRRGLVGLIVLISLSCLPVWGETLTADWQLALRIGGETEHQGPVRYKGDLGISLLGLIVGDVLLVVPLLPPEDSWKLDLLFGVPNAAAPVTMEGAMVSTGLSCRIGHTLRSGNILSLRLGAGFPFFFEEGRPIIRETQVPLGLWPDIGVEFRRRRE